MSSRRSSSTSSSKSSSSNKNIQDAIGVLLQSTEGDAKTILAKITDIDYLYKIFDIKYIKLFRSDKAGLIRHLIHVRIIQVLIKNKIEEQLEIYRNRRIELEAQFSLIRNTNRPNRPLNDAIQLKLNEAKELHRIATEKLQNSLKSGDLHIKQGEIEEAVKRVDEILTVARLRIRLLIVLLINIEDERKERISHTEVGRRLLQKNLTRGRQQPKNRN